MRKLVILSSICLVWWHCGSDSTKTVEEVIRLQSELLSCLQANKVLTGISAKDLPDAKHYEQHCTQNELSEIIRYGKCSLDKCMTSMSHDKVEAAIKECGRAEISQKCRGGIPAL